MSLACTLFTPSDRCVTHYNAAEPGEYEGRVRLGADYICGSDMHDDEVGARPRTSHQRSTGDLMNSFYQSSAYSLTRSFLGFV